MLVLRDLCLALGMDSSEIHSLASEFKPFYLNLNSAGGILRDKSISFSLAVYLTALLTLITLQVPFRIAVKAVALKVLLYTYIWLFCVFLPPSIMAHSRQACNSQLNETPRRLSNFFIISRCFLDEMCVIRRRFRT